MKQFQDILVFAEVYDTYCIDQVAQLAEAHGAAVTVCDVIEPPPRLVDDEGVADRLFKRRWALSFERLRRVQQYFSERLTIDHSVLTGIPFVTITEQVLEQGFDLVVHISAPVQKISGVGLNATGMHLMRKCPCTVWALHPQTPSLQNNVVLALDNDHSIDSQLADNFAVSLAESALTLCAAQDADLHIVHAWQPFGHDLLSDSSLELGLDEIDSYRKQQYAMAKRWFEAMVTRIKQHAYSPSRIKSHLIEGPAFQVVGDVISEFHANMLVLGNVGTSAKPGILIGATAESIMSGVGTPILALKPPGYQSPLNR
ncbi:universal stress protein family protein [Luminiphilus syltensis NOR5-1B]|uniref:Universal stress protein family protein n=1 Tax=Luminiphilus syltensis NOR5-1B TaxID=565045 RepID=B8KXA3_9GAMM|nr:universal stress protein [Luminiphilus syltensis]EED34824.1 universal stress protein family protein [Luminiphilus syltensis NOR5-1B]